MAQELINIGALPNDGEGDPLRVAFQKINNNFTQLFSTGFATTDFTTLDNTANQVIFEVPTTLFTQGNFKINSSNPLTNDSQNITIDASINNDRTAVKWVGYGTTVFNSPVTQYDMRVQSGNVQLLVSPLVNGSINHFISIQVEVSTYVPGIPLGLNGYADGTVLGAENGLIITTE